MSDRKHVFKHIVGCVSMTLHESAIDKNMPTPNPEYESRLHLIVSDKRHLLDLAVAGVILRSIDA